MSNLPLPAESGFKPTIFVVSDDLSMREQIHAWTAPLDANIRSYAHPSIYTSEFDADDSGCLVLDVRRSGSAGLSLIARLRDQFGFTPAAIVLTRADDVSAAVTAMKLGAVDVVHEPIVCQVFLDRLRVALEQDHKARHVHTEMARAKRAIGGLTPREREVLSHLLQGSANKEIAVGLGMNSKTASTHRTNIMQKMGVSNIVDLIRIMGLLHVAA